MRKGSRLMGGPHLCRYYRSVTVTRRRPGNPLLTVTHWWGRRRSHDWLTVVYHSAGRHHRLLTVLGRREADQAQRLVTAKDCPGKRYHRLVTVPYLVREPLLPFGDAM